MKKILVQRLADWMFERMISDAQAKGEKVVNLDEYRDPGDAYMRELAQKFPKTRSAELETASTIFHCRAEMHFAKMKAEMAFDEYIVGLVRPLMKEDSGLTVGKVFRLLADQGDIYAQEILESGLLNEELSIGGEEE